MKSVSFFRIHVSGRQQKQKRKKARRKKQGLKLTRHARLSRLSRTKWRSPHWEILVHWQRSRKSSRKETPKVEKSSRVLIFVKPVSAMRRVFFIPARSRMSHFFVGLFIRLANQ